MRTRPDNRKHVITASAIVPAEPSRVYAVLADYHNSREKDEQLSIVIA